MPLTRMLFTAVVSLTLASSVAPLSAQQTAQPALKPTAAQQQRVETAYGRLPLSFEPNRGQADSRVQFLAHSPQASIFLSGSDAVIQTSSFRQDAHGKPALKGSSAVRMHLAGASASIAASPEQPLSGTVNYLRGNDRTQWQQDVPTFGGVRLASVYPGVDLRYYGHAGQLEYDFIVAPQADPAAVKLQFQGAGARVEPNGDLVLSVPHGDNLRFDKPVAYQTIEGRRIPVQAAFSLAANHDIAFRLGAYDHTRELVIDPTLVYLGTLANGISQTNVSQITVDSSGALYMIGTTNETAFPTTPGAYQTVCGPANATAAGNNVTYCNGSNNTSAFITKLSPDGTQLVYSTFLSGHGGLETGSSIAVDSAGIAYLLGETASNDFPITSDAFQKLCQPAQPPGFEPAPVVPTSQCDNFHNGGGTEYTINGPEAFFAKLNAAGSSLIYASYLGGSLPVYPYATALDASGNWYIYVQTSLRPTTDLYGSGGGNVQYPGFTSSGYQIVSAPGTYVDNGAALSKFSNDGHTLLYGTFLGDNMKNVPVQPQSLAVGANGIAFIGGYTNSANFPTTAGVIKQSCTTPNTDGTCLRTDGFVAAINTNQSGAASLVWSTRLSGSSAQAGSPQTQVLGLVADTSNDVFATGITSDHTFPVGSNGFQSTCPNYNAGDGYDYCDSAYVVKINPSGTAVLNGSFLNDPRDRSPESAGYNVRLDSKGQVYVYGRSNDGAGNFPMVNPLQGYQGGNQLFISAFSADLSNLLFSTRFGNPSNNGHSVSPAGGMVLDTSDSIYFAGTTTDTMFAGTAGTYNTATVTGAGNHPFFAKLSKVLAPSVTTLILPPGSTGVGKPLTLSANVTGTTQTTPVATGSVTFTYTSTSTPTVAGTATLNGAGAATLNITAPATAGTYTVTASYGADSNYDVSASAPAALTVVNLPTPVVTLMLGNANVKTGAPATFNVTVTAPSGSTAVPGGTVTFKDGTGNLGTSTLSAGVASYSTSSLALGAHSITATYDGGATYAGATSAAQTETISTYTPAIAFTINPTTAQVNQNLTVTATLTAAAGGPLPTGNVDFYVDNTKLLLNGTTLNNGVVTLQLNFAAGAHTATAVYTGDGSNGAVTSSPVSFTITQPTAAIAFTASPILVAVGGAVTATATVTTAIGTGTPGGSVVFTDSNIVFASANLVNGQATVTTTMLAAGIHQLSAVYGGDSTFPSIASTTVVGVTVRPISTTTTTLSATTTNQLQGQPIGFTAVLTFTPATGSPSGVVDFYDGTTQIGTGIPNSGSAFFATSALTPGTHSITAAYVGDPYATTSTSAPLTVTITTQTVNVIATPDPLLIVAGHSGIQTLNVFPLNGFGGTVTFSCPNNPQYVACSFSPASLTFVAGTTTSQTMALTIYTNAAHTASLRQPASFFEGSGPSLAMLLWLPGSALALLGLRRRATFKALLTLVILVTGLGAACTLSGCGSGNNPSAAAQPGSYTIPITIIASNGTTQTLNTHITIQ